MAECKNKIAEKESQEVQFCERIREKDKLIESQKSKLASMEDNLQKAKWDRDAQRRIAEAAEQNLKVNMEGLKELEDVGELKAKVSRLEGELQRIKKVSIEDKARIKEQDGLLIKFRAQKEVMGTGLKFKNIKLDKLRNKMVIDMSRIEEANVSAAEQAKMYENLKTLYQKRVNEEKREDKASEKSRIYADEESVKAELKAFLSRNTTTIPSKEMKECSEETNIASHLESLLEATAVQINGLAIKDSPCFHDEFFKMKVITRLDARFVNGAWKLTQVAAPELTENTDSSEEVEIETQAKTAVVITTDSTSESSPQAPSHNADEDSEDETITREEEEVLSQKRAKFDLF